MWYYGTIDLNQLPRNAGNCTIIVLLLYYKSKWGYVTIFQRVN